MHELLSFGTWLKERRRALDLTQNELAQRIACSLSTLRKIEAENLVPSKELAQLLATALAVPAGDREAFIAFARGGKATALSALLPKTAPLARVPGVEAIKPEQPAYYLPAPLTGLVGRERELQSGCALLRRPHVRLVSLVGPPGAGKTRLSLALAKALQNEFSHGACFVPLEPINDPTLVLSAIAQSLYVRERAGTPLLRTLQDALNNQQLLLVLDNFEQVVAAAPQVGDLLAGAPGLKVIVSSRETLRLYGEYEFPVAPLAIPDIQRLPAPDLLEMYPAVELFLQRARAIRSDFAITAANAAAIAQLCAWLDGLPLAIEMAAARVKWQSPALLLEQLRKQLMALTGGPRDLTPRQQTLQGAMDWSFNLLTPVEQQIFVAFGVINGSGTANAVAACTDQDPLLCETLLQGLAEKSLLQFTLDDKGELRYTMLQMVRVYAQTKQAEFGLADHLHARHAAYYGRLAAESQPQLQTSAAEDLLNHLTLEHNNLRSALAWHLQADPEGGLKLATLLANGLWGIRGHFSEGRNWLEKLLAAAPGTARAALSDLDKPDRATTTLAAAQLAGARMALGQGDLTGAAAFAAASEQLALQAEDDSAVRAALRCRAAIALHQSDYRQATLLYQQALDLCHLETDQQEAATILNGLGLIAKDQGEYARALALHEQSYVLSAKINDTIGITRSLTYSSIAAYWQGDYQRCTDLAQQVITLQSGIGDVLSVNYSREILAMALVKMGRFAEGVQALTQCLDAFKTLEDRSGMAMMLVDLGQAAYMQQEYRRAYAYHHEALQLAHAIGDRRRCAFALEGMGMAITQLASTTEMYESAVRLYAAAAALRTAIGAPLPATERADYEACLALATAQLPPPLYAAARQQGAAISVSQLLQQCLNL